MPASHYNPIFCNKTVEEQDHYMARLLSTALIIASNVL
jgi:hypothetical protein